jgi:hypothetical protein
MDNSVSIKFGIPEHGWLPVYFHYKDFHLGFEASDALNDVIEELYNAVAKLQENELKRITWWLESGAFFFDIERKGQSIALTISETADLHNDSACKRQLAIITGGDKEIIEPFRLALRHFSSKTYEEIHWPYNLNKDKIRSL